MVFFLGLFLLNLLLKWITWLFGLWDRSNWWFCLQGAMPILVLFLPLLVSQQPVAEPKSAVLPKREV